MSVTNNNLLCLNEHYSNFSNIIKEIGYKIDSCSLDECSSPEPCSECDSDDNQNTGEVFSSEPIIIGGVTYPTGTSLQTLLEVLALQGNNGEVNTASNVGLAGVGVFKQKIGSNLEFNKINAGSNKVSVTNDIVNSEIDIDVNVSNLTGISQSQITNLTSNLALKAPLFSPSFTGIVSGITKTMVGLSDVDNTSDLSKPISVLTQVALDTKQPNLQFQDEAGNVGTLGGITTVNFTGASITASDSGSILTVDVTGGGGGGATNLGLSNHTSTTIDITSDTGSDVTIPQATTSLSGLLIASDKVKLNSTSGTNSGDNAVNSLYSGLVSNATHTGDATGSVGLTVVGINGTILSGLSTGILKNTTGTGIPSIAVPGDFPILNQNTTGSAATLTTPRTISITGDLSYVSPLFDGSGNISAIGTLATVNSNTGTFGSATQVAMPTVNAKGLITAISNVTITPAASSITGGNALTKTDDTNVTLTLGGGHATALLNATSLTLGWTGALSVTRGGTGLGSLGTALQQLRVNAGATALEYFTPSSSRITSLNGLTGTTQTFTDDTNVSIVSGGTSHVITWNGTLADSRITSSSNWNTAYTNRITALTTAGNSGSSTLTSNILNIPNYTLLGLGGQPLDSDLTAIAALTGTSGFLKTNGAGTWNVDTNTYLTGNQNISLSGEASGSGTTGISVTLTNSAVIGKVLTGFSSTTGTILATDSILQAIQKLDGNLAAATAGGVSSVTGTTNRITSTGGSNPIIDISSSYVGQSSITTLGTITTATWNATPITDLYISSASAWNALVSNATHTGDATGATALTLATVNSNVGTFGSATQIGQFTVNAKGLTTAASNVAIAIPASQITDFAEATDDRVAALIQNGTGITWSYNDASGTLTPTVTVSAYTDEQAQDAIGAMVDSSIVYVDGTPLLTRAALTGAITASQGSNATALGSFTLSQLNTAISDADVSTGGGTATGTNTGDQTSIVGITGTKAQFDTALTDGNFLYVGDISQYTDELAQDAIGTMLDATLVYVDATPLLTRAALTGDVTASQGSNATTIANNVVTNAKLAQAPANTLKGNNTGGVANEADLTTSQVKTMLAIAASDISNTPSGSIASTTVQTALNELAGEKHTNIQFRNEGTDLSTAGTVDVIDFTGTAVTASRIGNVLTVDIPATSGVTNLAYTASSTQGIVTSDTGTDATIPAADGTNAGLMLPAQFTKLSNVTITQAVDLDALEADVADLTTLSGVASNSTALGTFTGTTIADNVTIKVALQSLETSLEASTTAGTRQNEIRTVTVNTTLSATTDGTVIFTTAGTVATLPSPTNKIILRIKNASGGNITMTGHLDGNASQTQTIPDIETRTLHGDGATWWIVG